MMDVNQPQIVEMPEPITVLESALTAIQDDSSKSIYLEPRQARELRLYIKELESMVRVLGDAEYLNALKTP